MSVEIRICRPGDESLFDHIAEEVFDWPFERAKLGRYLAMPGQHLIIAISAGEIVGQLSAVSYQHPEARSGELYVDELGVTPSMQRRGIATRLVEAARSIATDQGCSDIWLAFEPDNQAASAFYATLAGEVTGARLFSHKLPLTAAPSS